MENTEYTNESTINRLLRNKVLVTSAVTSTCCSTCTAVGSSVKSRPATKSKSTARKRSVKPTKRASAPKSKSTDKSTTKSSTSTTASCLESTAKNTYIEPYKEQSFRYVLPEFVPKPAINPLDDSKKASDSFKNGSVKKNTITSSATCIAPTASTLSYTMDRSYMQSMNKELSRHLLPEIRQQYESQEPSNPYKNGSLGNYMKYFPTALVPTVYPSSNALRWHNVPMGSSQLSANDTLRCTLPEMKLQPEVKKPDSGKKESNPLKNGSVTDNTKTLDFSKASTSSNTMGNNILQTSAKDNFRYVVAQIKLPPNIKHLDSSKKAAYNSFKNRPSTENTEAAVASMGTPASSSIYTTDNIHGQFIRPQLNQTNSSLQPSTNDLFRYGQFIRPQLNQTNSCLQPSAPNTFRYVLPETKLPPKIKHRNSSKKAASNSFKNGSSTENTEAAIASMGTPACSSSYTMDNIHGQFIRPQLNQTNSSLQPSTNDLFRYGQFIRPQLNQTNSCLQPSAPNIFRNVLPETKLPPKIKHLNSSKKAASNSFKNGSSTENTEAAIESMGTPACSSSYTMDNIHGQFIRPHLSQTRITLHPSAQNLSRYVVAQIKLPPKIKHLDSSKKAASNSFKNGSSRENTEAAVASMGTPASNSIYTTDNIHGQFIRPQLNQTNSSLQPSTNALFRYVLPETRHLDNSKKSTSDSFKNGSSTENTEAAVASMRTQTYSSTMDESSLQSSSKPATSEETFKPVMIEDNSAKNPDPIRTGSPIDNTEVAATRSKGSFAGSFYIIGDDGKFSVLVTDNNGEPTSKIKFRSDGTPDEKAYPVDFSKFDKPEMAAILRYEIEKTLRNAGEVTNIYHIYIKETIRVELTVKNLQKHSGYKRTKGLKGTENEKCTNMSPYEDRLNEHLKLAVGILPQLPKDILRLREVFECINNDRALLERKLDSMKNAHLSIAESAEAYNANQVMNLWLDRFHKLLGKSDERIKRFDSIRNEILRMFVYEQMKKI